MVRVVVDCLFLIAFRGFKLEFAGSRIYEAERSISDPEAGKSALNLMGLSRLQRPWLLIWTLQGSPRVFGIIAFCMSRLCLTSAWLLSLQGAAGAALGLQPSASREPFSRELLHLCCCCWPQPGEREAEKVCECVCVCVGLPQQRWRIRRMTRTDCCALNRSVGVWSSYPALVFFSS